MTHLSLLDRGVYLAPFLHPAEPRQYVMIIGYASRLIHLLPFQDNECETRALTRGLALLNLLDPPKALRPV